MLNWLENINMFTKHYNMLLSLKHIMLISSAPFSFINYLLEKSCISAHCAQSYAGAIIASLYTMYLMHLAIFWLPAVSKW